MRGLVCKNAVEIVFFSKPSSMHPSRRARSVKIMVLPAREHDFQDSQGCQYGAKIEAKMLPNSSKVSRRSSQKPKKATRGTIFTRNFESRPRRQPNGAPGANEILRACNF